MYVQPLVTEAQRVNAYRSAQANYRAVLEHSSTAATPFTGTPSNFHTKRTQQAAPSSGFTTETREAARRAAEKRIKFELLRRLHAASNAGSVKIRDVSRAFDDCSIAR